MNLLREEAGGLASRIKASMRDGVEVVLFPPFTLIDAVRAGLGPGQAGIALGGQNCHTDTSGAFTGEVSAPMLADAGCRWVLLGHSERRRLNGETSPQVAAKAEQALAAGLDVMVCVGETLEEREAGSSESVVGEQLRGSLPASVPAERLAVAYEPVWAIGTGKVAAEGDVAKMHGAIRSILEDVGAGAAPVLYGGSVNASNATVLLGLDGVDGVLVGGASLKADDFAAIIEAGALL